MDERVPAECWPVGHFVAEEMAARGWTAADVAERMRPMNQRDRDVWELTVDLIVHCSDEPGVVIGQDTADRLGIAFGVSPQFFINLNNSYQAWRRARGVSPAPEASQ